MQTNCLERSRRDALLHPTRLQFRFALAILASLPCVSQAEFDIGDRVAGATAPLSQSEGSGRYRLRRFGPPPKPQAISLDPVPSSGVASERSLSHAPGIPHKIGFARNVPQLQTSAGTSANLHWESTPGGGSVAAVTLTSPNASGIRLGVHVKRLPSSAAIRFYDPNQTDAHEFTAKDVSDSIQRNVDAGENSESGKTFWSPYIEGQSVTVEIELQAGTSPADLEISIPRISHIYAPPVTSQAGVFAQSQSCEMDATCSSTWADEENATAKITFVDESGMSWLCSGTLLNNAASDFTPYFLSANHCISNQIRASSLETWWFYRSAACGSSVPDAKFTRNSGGATLLYASPLTDTAFMRLIQSPPPGAVFAGWIPNALAAGSAVTGIHHPRGDLQKISFGNVSGFMDCTGLSVTDTFYCSPTSSSNAEYLAVTPTGGIWEPGSSGSGLFTAINGIHYLAGQLLGGITSCANPRSPGYFGRFDLAYAAALSRWLRPSSSVSLNVSSLGNGTVTSLPTGIACGLSCNAPFSPGTTLTLAASAKQGAVFAGWSGACSGSTPVCKLTLNSSQSVTANFSSVPLAGTGYLGTPMDGTTVSGVGVISGYHCSSKDIDVYIDGAWAGKAGAGTRLLGTQGVCGRTDTGYSILYNFNNLTNGLHVITVSADGIQQDSHTVTTFMSGGVPWLTGVSRTGQITDFPQTGQTATLQWVQSYQNFLITAIDDGSGPYLPPYYSTSNVLGVSVAGAAGRVTSLPSGIACTTGCSAYFPIGTIVTLAASAPPGSVFTSWTGGCVGSGPVCQVVVNSDQTVIANFASVSPPGIGYLGTPVADTTVSGVGVISGYHCTSKDIDVYVDGVWAGKAGAGTRLLGTQGVCGRTDTGYSILYNFNNLANGLHVITVSADGIPQDAHAFTTVKSGGIPWLTGASRIVTVPDFPTPGTTSVIQWVQSYQNFLITGTK